MDTKVNLRGMINLDQVEDLLSEVLTRMDAQDKNLHIINETLKSLMPRQSAERCIDELHEAVKVLSGRVDAVREASVARVDNKLISAGELSSQNKTKLDQIFVTLSDIATKAQHLEADVKCTLGEHSEALEAVQGDYTPIDMSRALQGGLKECGGRIDLCEVAITKKVDKSVLGHIESLVVDLEKYSQHRTRAEDKLARLEHQTASLLEGLEEQAKLLEKNTANDDVFSRQTTATQQAFRDRLHSLQSLVEAHDRAIADDCVHKSSFSELLQWSDNASSLLTQFEHRHKTMKSSLDDVSALVSTKADSGEVAKYYMRREKVYEIIEAMGKDIEIRAKNSELQGTQGTLRALEEVVDQQHTQLQIALRFVEWFTQRGDTYESNMQVIDKHLKQLATSSVGGQPGSRREGTGGSSREPYMAENAQTFTQREKVRYFSIHPSTTQPSSSNVQAEK